MSVAAALVAGGLIGIRHAFEPDHLAAIATLVDRKDDATSAGRVGASWGIGHSLPVLLLGMLFVLVGIRLPAGVTTLFEVAVGVVLILLGAQMLYETAEPALIRHAHGSDDGHATPSTGHAHSHAHETACSHAHHHQEAQRSEPDGPHRHLHLGGLSLGSTHSHVDDASFLVGVLHGLAGSGLLVIALVSAAPSIPTAVAFLVAFSGLSILTMGGVSYLWGRSLEWGIATALQTLAGVMGVGVGGLLIATHLFGLTVL